MVLAVVLGVPMLLVFSAPFFLLGGAANDFFDRRWLAGAAYAVGAGLAYLVVFRIAGRRFLTWAEGRHQGEQP